MIGLKINGHNFGYELSDIIKMFFGKEEIILTDSEAIEEAQSFILVSSLFFEKGSMLCKSEIRNNDRAEEYVFKCEILNHYDDKMKKHAVKISMYKLLSKALNKEFPWGILTGIRPIKLIHELMDKELSYDQILRRMGDKYLVSEDRSKLALEIAEIERKYIYPINERAVSIYVGIPFCPSRCHYCSFTSNSIKSAGKYVQDYLGSLNREISEVGAYLRDNRIAIESIYLGGGTPTSINDEQLEALMGQINSSFGSSFKEFTCEAGRPDTITAKKLEILKKGNISRLSINPQTMNNETLVKIGRAHDAESIISKFALAREKGFDNINMDIILGLPGETTEELKITLQELEKLQPDSVTVHTMAIKRASVYNETYGSIRIAEDDEIIKMMELSKSTMKQMNMYPYYLYRQKHMLQNMENIGFCTSDKECIYNMQIIEEKQTNVAFGADAVTKVVFNGENRIERQHNIKDVKLYIENTGRMIENKLALLKESFDK